LIGSTKRPRPELAVLAALEVCTEAAIFAVVARPPGLRSGDERRARGSCPTMRSHGQLFTTLADGGDDERADLHLAQLGELSRVAPRIRRASTIRSAIKVKDPAAFASATG
jgi:hypothetical protein